MKLKSKLIATIVSMCAAIAVMGVGVWAATTNQFILTVNNDVDVKIINVKADVYGEYAIYTQFLNQSTPGDGTSPAYATKYTNNRASGSQDEGFLLYAITIGINNGSAKEWDKQFDYENVKRNGYGYNSYINNAKDYVFLSTANGTLTNSNTDEDPAYVRNPKEEFNVDYTTHVAQITYMYTIKQWAADQGDDNTIYGRLFDVNLSEDTQSKLAAAAKGSDANAQVRINAYISKADKASASVASAWYPLAFTNNESAFILPKDATNSQDYYIILTYTFARNNENLDLSLLKDSFNHSLELVAEPAEGVDYKDFGTTISTGTQTYLYSANASYTGIQDDSSYVVHGDKVTMNWAKDVAKVEGTAQGSEAEDTTGANWRKNPLTSHLPSGYIYLGATSDSDVLHADWQWLSTLATGGRTTNVSSGFVS